MRILVLGGAGFIGTNFVQYLDKIKTADAVMVADKLTYAGRRENIQTVLDKNGWQFEQLDIVNSAATNILVKDFRPTVIINFAAETHVSRSVVGPQIFTMTNVLGTQSVLDAIRGFAPECRYIHISTDEVFGHLAEWEGPWSDHAPLNPRSPYAASKAGGELLARSYFTTYGLNTSIVRPSNCFGRYQFPEKLIPRSITNLLDGDNIQLMGQGNEIRDWLYVEDLCADLLCICQYGQPGEAYNIPGDSLHRNRDIAHMILKFMDLGVDRITSIPHRLAHDFKYHVDGKNIEKLRGRRESSFTMHLYGTLEWYIQNPSWWTPLKAEAERGNLNAHKG